MDRITLSQMTVAQLESVVSTYPWFVAAHQELFLKMSEMGLDSYSDALKKSRWYLYPFRLPFRKGYSAVCSASDGEGGGKPIYSLDFNEVMPVIVPTPGRKEATKDEQTPRKEYIVIGGDYFSPEEVRSVSEPIVPEVRQEEEESRGLEGIDDYLYTETLARIYAEQQFYYQAIEVYNKLILLYPEKSAYFASLKEELKKNL